MDRVELITEAQRRTLNAICGDLSRGIDWHGFRLSKDDWRHMLAGTVKGWRTMPAIDRCEGQAGFIMLGGSSLELSTRAASEAIDLGLSIGNVPQDQGLKSEPLRWSKSVILACYITGEMK